MSFHDVDRELFPVVGVIVIVLNSKFNGDIQEILFPIDLEDRTKSSRKATPKVAKILESTHTTLYKGRGWEGIQKHETTKPVRK